MALFDSSKRNKETRISPVSKRFTPLQQTQYPRFSQMSVHSSYLFHIQSVPSIFPVAPLCTDMHSFPSPPAFHCQKAYWLYQEIPILQAYILDCSQLIYCMDPYSRSSVNPLMRALLLLRTGYSFL